MTGKLRVISFSFVNINLFLILLGNGTSEDLMVYFFLIQPILSIKKTDKMDIVLLLYLLKIFTRYFKLYCLILIYLLSAWLLIYSSQGVLLIGLCVFTILHRQPMTQNPLKPYVHVLTAIQHMLSCFCCW